MFRSRLIWQGVSLLALVLIVFTGSIALSGHVAAQEEVDPAGGYADMNNAMGAKMMKAIAATPGHLGSEVARTESGKTVIFSWFEDKESVLDWYYSDYHQQSMEMLFDDHGGREPLKHIKDDCGPIMTIAAITMSDKKDVRGVDLPIKQISIELYQALPAGLQIGGSFTPKAALPKVPPTKGAK